MNITLDQHSTVTSGLRMELAIAYDAGLQLGSEVELVRARHARLVEIHEVHLRALNAEWQARLDHALGELLVARAQTTAARMQVDELKKRKLAKKSPRK